MKLIIRLIKELIMKFKQYIPVKQSNPDPAVYCPANGYIPDPAVWNDPIQSYPESTSESIIFLGDSNFGDWLGSNINIFQATGHGQFVYELFDQELNLVSTLTTSNGSPTIAIPFRGYFILKVSLVNPGGYFTRYYNTHTSTDFGSVIIKAIFNTPNLTSCAAAFQYQVNLVEVIFNCTLMFLTTFRQAFQYSSIRNFIFQSSYPELTDCSYMFTASLIYSILFPRNCALPKLLSLDRFATTTKNLRTLELPSQLPVVTTVERLCNDTPLQQILLWEYAPFLQNLNSAFSNADLRGTIIFPPMPSLTGFLYGIMNNRFLKKIVFQGNTDSWITDQNCFYDLFALEELVYPNTSSHIGAYAVHRSNVSLRKVKVVDKVFGTSGIINVPIGPVEEITGDGDNSERTIQQNITIPSSMYNSLRVFNLPKFHTSKIVFGNSSTDKLTKLEILTIDWANSLFTGASPQIQIAASVDSIWLNDLFYKLPALENKTIDVRFCDGYATCDKSIAQAKGWTVL